MQRVKFNISPDSIIISYFFIALMLASVLMGLSLYTDVLIKLLPILFALYHGGFWLFFGWYGYNYYKHN